MKTITLTVAEFLILKEVREASYDLYGEVEKFLEENEDKTELPELKVESYIFDDMISMIKDYKDDPAPKDFTAIDALLLKLEAVEEIVEEVTESVTESTDQPEPDAGYVNQG